MSSLDLFREKVPEPELDERYTPQRYFDEWNAEFRFDLDACATAESAKCERYFTKAEDGLSQSWERARVFVNPPYSDIASWVWKAWRSNADLVVMLVPNWTDREWWHEHVEPFRDESRRDTGKKMSLLTRFLPGRIRFELPHGRLTPGRPTWGSCLLIWVRS